MFQGFKDNKMQDLWETKRNNLQLPHLKKIQRSAIEESVEVKSLDGFAVGDKVRHSMFGKGVIISLESDGANSKAKIEFEHLGQKSLFLKYAKLTVINE
jgi:DNA helicase-2/ATP-dependent DNA helicase PcrA